MTTDYPENWYPVWFFTFAQKYAHENHPVFPGVNHKSFVTIHAENADQARDRMNSITTEWAFQYSLEEFEPQVEEFDLVHYPLQGVVCEPVTEKTEMMKNEQSYQDESHEVQETAKNWRLTSRHMHGYGLEKTGYFNFLVASGRIEDISVPEDDPHRVVERITYFYSTKPDENGYAIADQLLRRDVGFDDPAKYLYALGMTVLPRDFDLFVQVDPSAKEMHEDVEKTMSHDNAWLDEALNKLAKEQS